MEYQIFRLCEESILLGCHQTSTTISKSSQESRTWLRAWFCLDSINRAALFAQTRHRSRSFFGNHVYLEMNLSSNFCCPTFADTAPSVLLLFSNWASIFKRETYAHATIWETEGRRGSKLFHDPFLVFFRWNILSLLWPFLSSSFLAFFTSKQDFCLF